MRGFVTPRNPLRGEYGVDHGFLGKQTEGVRKRNAVTEHGADDGFTFNHRLQKRRPHKPLPFKLFAQLAEQRLLVNRRVADAEMGGVEVFIQHPRAGAVYQHQLANLLQLIISRKRCDHHYRFCFFTDARGSDNKVLAERFHLLVLAQRERARDLNLRVFTLEYRLNHTHHRITGVTDQQHARLALVANVVVTLQPDANVQHQETNFVFADRIRRVFSPVRYRRQGHVPGHRVVLLDIIQQRIGDHDLIPHAGDHRLDVREQIRVQLRVAEQVVVVVGVDVAQDVVHQRLFVIGVNGAWGDLLDLPRSDVHAEPVLLRGCKRFARQFLNGHSNIFRRFPHVLLHILRMEFRQRIAFADASH